MTASSARVAIGGAVAALLVVLWAAGAGAQAAPPTLLPATASYGPVMAGDSTSAQTFTFSSASPVMLNSVGTTGPFGITGGSCTPGVVASCTVNVAFSPTVVGTLSGSVFVVYNADNTVRSTLTGVATPATTTTVPATTTTVEETTTTARATTTTATTTAPRPTTTTATATTTTVESTTSTLESTTTTVAETTTSTSTSTTTSTLAPAPAGRGPTLDATAAGGRRSGPPGIGITVTGAGYPAARDGAGEEAAPSRAQSGPACPTVYFFVDGRRIGSTGPDTVGDVRKSGLSVPGDVDPGRHDVAASCRSAGTPVLATSTFEVTDAAIHRNALATSLPQVDQIDFGADQLLISALAVLGLLVMIAFPAELFNTTLEEHYDEVRGWFGLKPRPLGGGRHHGALLAAFLLLSGPLWFAMQASSRLDAATAVGALGLSLATGVVVLASDLPEVVHVRRRYRERASPIALPGSFVIAVACVLLSRAVHFQPGYFYGLLGGLALSRSLEKDESGRLAGRTVAFLLVLSIGAWLALLPVSAAAAEDGKTFGTILVENLLGGIFWCALDSLVIAMLPLRLLEGSKVVGWSRLAWGVLYGVTLLAFVHILLRPGTGYVSNTSVSPAGVVIGLFVGFAVFSFAFWGYFRFRKSDPEALPDEVEGATRPVPVDVLVAEGVGAGEVDGGPVGAVDRAGDGQVGRQPVEPEDRDPV